MFLCLSWRIIGVGVGFDNFGSCEYLRRGANGNYKRKEKESKKMEVTLQKDSIVLIKRYRNLGPIYEFRLGRKIATFGHFYKCDKFIKIWECETDKNNED